MKVQVDLDRLYDWLKTLNTLAPADLWPAPFEPLNGVASDIAAAITDSGHDANKWRN